MAKLVLTAIGDDREGLVSALSAVVDDHGGNWLDSEFARLSGKFAGIVLVDVEESRHDEFDAALTALEGTVGWTVVSTPVADTGGPGVHVPATSSPLHLHLVGLDSPGTVREVTTALAAQRVTIDRFHSWTTDAPEGGGTLFEVDATVRLGEGTDEADLREALETIAAELMVDLDLDAEL